MTSFFLCGEIHLCGCFELGSLSCPALVLESAKFGRVFFTLAAETGFLNIQISDLFLVGEERMQLGEARAEGRIAISEELGELFAASGEERHFESGNPLKTPGAVGDGLDESRFARSNGLKLFQEIGDVLLVAIGVVGREKDSAPRETGFHGIQTGFGFALRRFGTGGSARLRLRRSIDRAGNTGSVVVPSMAGGSVKIG